MAGPGDDPYHLPYPAAAPPPPVTGDPDRPAADEVRTIFITGLPVDVKERELQNMLRWLPGYETCEINFKEEHPMGFALFSTAQHALAAKTAVQGLIFDGETKSVLHTEMAKENLNVKRDSNDELEGSSDEIQDLLGSQVPSTQTSSQLLQPLDEGTLITPITQMSPLRMQTVDLESPIDGDPMSFERSSRKRGKNFSILEDELLCKAWLTITKDEVVGNLQRTPSFYNRLKDHFNRSKVSKEPRSIMSVKSRWEKISKGVDTFVRCLAQINRVNQSGTTWNSKIEEAKAKFCREEKVKAFPFEHCWKILQVAPKWKMDGDPCPTKNLSSRVDISVHEDLNIERLEDRKQAKNPCKKSNIEEESSSNVDMQIVNIVDDMKGDTMAKKQLRQRKDDFFKVQTELAEFKLAMKRRKEENDLLCMSLDQLDDRTRRHFEGLKAEILARRESSSTPFS